MGFLLSLSFLFIHVLPSYFFSITIIAYLNCALNPFSTQLTGNRNGFITPNNLFTVDFALITTAALSAGPFLPDCKPSTIFVAVAVLFNLLRVNTIFRPSGQKNIRSSIIPSLKKQSSGVCIVISYSVFIV